MSVKEPIDKTPEQTTYSCKNCKTKFEGKYCPNCGQSTFEFDRPFSFLIVDMLGNVFAFDTRFWLTFVSLVIKPGKYTIDYLKGNRARYAPPFRVYLFISLAFFLLLSQYIQSNIDLSDEKKLEYNESINKELNSENVDVLLDSIDNLNWQIDMGGGDDRNGFLNGMAQIINNPGIYINSFLRFFSWSLFFIMPVFAFYLWVLFRKQRKYYLSHLIYALNTHAFTFLLISLILVIKLLFPGGNTWENLLFLYLPIYVYIGTYRFYRKGWFTTFIRLSTALFLYLFTLSITFAIILFLWVKVEFL